MFWIDTTEHNFNLWLDEDGSTVAVVMTDDPVHREDYPVSALIDMGGVFDIDSGFVRFKTMPGTSDWMKMFSSAKIRWLMPGGNRIKSMPGDRIQWAFRAVNPDPGALDVVAGQSLSDELFVYATTEIEAASVGGRAVADTASLVHRVARHPTDPGLFYGFPLALFKPGFDYSSLLPRHNVISVHEDESPDELDFSDQRAEDSPEDIGSSHEAAEPGSGDDSSLSSDLGRRSDFGRVIPGARKDLSVSFDHIDDKNLIVVRERLKRTLSIDQLWPKKASIETMIENGASLAEIGFALAVRESLYSSYPQMVPLKGKNSRGNKWIGKEALMAGSFSLAASASILRQRVERFDEVDRYTFMVDLIPASIDRWVNSRVSGPLTWRIERALRKQSNHDSGDWVELLSMHPNGFSLIGEHVFDLRPLPTNEDGTIDMDQVIDLLSANRTPELSLVDFSKRRLDDLIRRLPFDGFSAITEIAMKKYPDISSQLSEINSRLVDFIRKQGEAFDHKIELINSDYLSSRVEGMSEAEIKERAEASVRDLVDFSYQYFRDNDGAYQDAMTRLSALVLERGNLSDLFKAPKRSKIERADNSSSVKAIDVPSFKPSSMPINVPDSTPITRTSETNWRQGAEIGEEALCSRFGFSGIQYGNYVNQKERQSMLNDCYDALADMACAMDLPDRFMGFNGRMALAFGARGRGGVNAALAHYEPSQRVINFTKRKGAGTLAHEWAHGLDNYLGEKLNTLYLSEHLSPNEKHRDMATSMQGFMNRLKVQDNYGVNEDSMMEIIKKSAFEQFMAGITKPKYMEKAKAMAMFELRKQEIPEREFDQVISGIVDRLATHFDAVRTDPSYLFQGKDGGRIVYSIKLLIPLISENLVMAGKEPLSEIERAFVQNWFYQVYAESSELYKKSEMSSRHSLKIQPYETMFSFSGRVLDSISGKKNPYWASTREYFARGLSSVIHHMMAEKNLGNDWATKISEPGLFGSGYITSPNLEGSEIEVCSREFENGLLVAVRDIAILELGPRDKDAELIDPKNSSIAANN